MTIRNYTIMLASLLILSAASACGQVTGQPNMTDREKEAAASFKQLLDLLARLKKIPFGGDKREPHKSFLKTNEKSVVYSDPSGEYYVRSDLFWQLRNKYHDLPIAENIAWTAAQNPLPGECEGFVNCYVYLLQETKGRYLGFYPKGKYSREAVADIKELFTALADDGDTGPGYSWPEDAGDRTELKKMLEEIDSVMAKVAGTDALAVRALIKRFVDRYK